VFCVYVCNMCMKRVTAVRHHFASLSPSLSPSLSLPLCLSLQEDLCPECYASKGTNYKLAQRCVDGQDVGNPYSMKGATSKAAGSANKKKQASQNKAVAPKKTTQTKTKKK